MAGNRTIHLFFWDTQGKWFNQLKLSDNNKTATRGEGGWAWFRTTFPCKSFGITKWKLIYTCSVGYNISPGIVSSNIPIERYPSNRAYYEDDEKIRFFWNRLFALHSL